MSDETVTTTLVAFAAQLEDCAGPEEARKTAQARDWIDADGRPTQEGRSVYEALSDQRETRSTFRNTV